MNQPKNLELLPKYYAPSSWWEHVPIAHWIIEKLKPNTIAELGTHYGVSFFSFCEAAEAYSPDTYIYAIDTWEGDGQAGYYKNEVYTKVYENRMKWHSQRSSMLRCTFDEAASRFSEKSIDLIHIDGLHTYEAVRNDFEIWKDKLKENGTIMFHDWNVREKDFGVWKLWDEIKNDSNYQCIETPNGYGLGLATLTTTKPIWHDELQRDLAKLITKGKLLKDLQDEKDKNEILAKEMKTQNQHSINLETIKNENMNYIDSLIKELEETRQIKKKLEHEIEQGNRTLQVKIKSKLKRWFKILFKKRA